VGVIVSPSVFRGQTTGVVPGTLPNIGVSDVNDAYFFLVVPWEQWRSSLPPRLGVAAWLLVEPMNFGNLKLRGDDRASRTLGDPLSRAGTLQYIVAGLSLVFVLTGCSAAKQPDGGRTDVPTSSALKVGYEWTLQEVRSDSFTVQPIPETRTTTVIFGDDGKLRGSDRLNSFSADYAYDTNRMTLTFTNGVSTLVGAAFETSDETRVVNAVNTLFLSLVTNAGESQASLVMTSFNGSQLSLKVSQYELVFT